MYCRKCLKESDGEDKINMEVDIESQQYICPECENVVKWTEKEEEI